MTEFDKILELADDKTVQLSQDFKDLLGTELQLGQSNFVCKNGTLSDGFEKLLPSQRYYQAVREMWSYGSNIRETKAHSMKAQAVLKWYSLLDKLIGWVPIVGMFIKANKMIAIQRITNLLVGIEDQVRIIKAFNEERERLQPEVRAKYKSIEEAEPDHWDAVLKYRMARQKLGKQEMIQHVPGTAEHKALTGVMFGAPEAALWLAIEKEQEISDKYDGDVLKYLEANGHLKLLPEHTGRNVVSFKKKEP